MTDHPRLFDLIRQVDFTAINRALATLAPVVAAWGTHGHGLPQVAHVRAIAREHDVDLQALKVTKHGDPGHPLYVRQDATLSPWPTTGTEA